MKNPARAGLSRDVVRKLDNLRKAEGGRDRTRTAAISPRKIASSLKSGALGGAVDLPADLQLIAEAWPTLPVDVRASILAAATAG
jgi:hypothetical protein